MLSYEVWRSSFGGKQDVIGKVVRIDGSPYTMVVRTSGDPHALVPALRQAVHAIDPSVPFRAAETMEQIVREQLIFERMEGWLFGIFAGFAVLLAVIGLYGLVDHEVELRTREIGIHMALGSTRRLVVMQILRRVALLIGVGTCVGWALSLALRRLLTAVSALHTGNDLVLMLGVTLALATVGILASLIPSRNAALTQPVQALRSE